MSINFDILVDYIRERLIQHHEIYESPCRSEYWEEVLSWALKKSGFGSDWKPNLSHKIGEDQRTDNNIILSNKSGSILETLIEFSGSRLGKHLTLEDKLHFLSQKTEDYVVCLATDKKEWKSNHKCYYFIIIDSNKLNYSEQIWTETFGKRGKYKDQVNGWKCTCESYSAKIQKGMSDQIWTQFELAKCDEIYVIEI